MPNDEKFVSSYSEPKSFWKKVKQEPLVPLGCLVTAGILIAGLLTMARGPGTGAQQQRLMRARVVSQLVTAGIAGSSVAGFTWFKRH